MAKISAILHDPSNRLRAVAILSLVLWALSLALPASWSVFEYEAGVPLKEQAVVSSPGWSYLLLGWAGPANAFEGGLSAPTPDMVPPGAHPMLPPTDLGAFLALFSWYANPLWLWTIARLLRKARPHPLVPLAAAFLAVAALQPLVQGHITDSHGVDSAEVPAIGAWLWAAAICLPGLALLLARLWASRPAADGRSAEAP
jgi:hypothetical protein